MKRKIKKLTNPLLDELKGYLKANHISQERAAREIGVSYVTLNRWMKGHTNPVGLAVAAVRGYLEGGRQ